MQPEATCSAGRVGRIALSEIAVGLHELFSGPAALFCSTNELASYKAANYGQFGLQRNPRGEQTTTCKQCFKIKLFFNTNPSKDQYLLVLLVQHLVFSERLEMLAIDR